MSGETRSSVLLLDTCAMIWLANGSPLPPAVVDAIIAAGKRDNVYVSVASAWEIGMLSARKPGRPALEFRPDPKSWFSRFVAGPGIRQVDLTPAIAIDASHLPGDMHGDPSDRLIVSTARHIGATIVTRDRKIISYAEGGFVDVLAC
jgi:PIN domain nuclease of toxin-antitoxin system